MVYSLVQGVMDMSYFKIVLSVVELIFLILLYSNGMLRENPIARKLFLLVIVFKIVSYLIALILIFLVLFSSFNFLSKLF